MALEQNDIVKLAWDPLASAAIQAISVFKKSETSPDFELARITDLPKISHDSLVSTTSDSSHNSSSSSPTASSSAQSSLNAPGSPSGNRSHNLASSRNLTSSTGNLHQNLNPVRTRSNYNLTNKSTSFRNSGFGSTSNPRARVYHYYNYKEYKQPSKYI